MSLFTPLPFPSDLSPRSLSTSHLSSFWFSFPSPPLPSPLLRATLGSPSQTPSPGHVSRPLHKTRCSTGSGRALSCSPQAVCPEWEVLYTHAACCMCYCMMGAQYVVLYVHIHYCMIGAQYVVVYAFLHDGCKICRAVRTHTLLHDRCTICSSVCVTA